MKAFLAIHRRVAMFVPAFVALAACGTSSVVANEPPVTSVAPTDPTGPGMPSQAAPGSAELTVRAVWETDRASDSAAHRSLFADVVLANGPGSPTLALTPGAFTLHTDRGVTVAATSASCGASAGIARPSVAAGETRACTLQFLVDKGARPDVVTFGGLTPRPATVVFRACVACSDGCVDIQTDAADCGACGQTVESGTCQAGAPRCDDAAPTATCGTTACTRLDTAQHCTQCGFACDTLLAACLAPGGDGSGPLACVQANRFTWPESAAPDATHACSAECVTRGFDGCATRRTSCAATPTLREATHEYVLDCDCWRAPATTAHGTPGGDGLGQHGGVSP